MNTKFPKKRGISTVLTTIIILVASVVLGSGVVLYTSLQHALCIDAPLYLQLMYALFPNLCYNTAMGRAVEWMTKSEEKSEVRKRLDDHISVDLLATGVLSVAAATFGIEFFKWIFDPHCINRTF